MRPEMRHLLEKRKERNKEKCTLRIDGEHGEDLALLGWKLKEAVIGIVDQCETMRHACLSITPAYTDRKLRNYEGIILKRIIILC